jgi:hypothetical protein
MKLKANDHYTRFYVLFKAKLLTIDDYKALKDSAKEEKLPKNFMEYTLDEYFGLLNAVKGGDLSIINYIFGKEKKEMTIAVFFGRLKAIEKQFKNVKNAFDSIQKPPMSSEARQAGFGNLDFGEFGLLDYIAKRQNLSDKQASETLLGFVIMKLQNDAKVAMCEWRMNEIVKNKYKTK